MAQTRPVSGATAAPAGGGNPAWRLDLAVLFAAGAAAVLTARLTGFELPNYVDALLALSLILVLPGAALARIVAPSLTRDLPGLLALSIPFGVASLVPATVASFALGLSMETAIAIALVTGGALALACATPLAPPGTPMRYTITPGEETLLLALLLVALSPVWLRVDLSRDADDWWYLGYVREYRESDEIAPTDPLAGPDAPISVRVAVDVWLVGEGAMSRLSDLEPVYFVQSFLPPFVLAAMILAVFALTRRLAGNEEAALIAAAAVGLAAAIDLLATEGFGRLLVVRAAQDKVVSGLLGVPVFLLVLFDLTVQRSRRSFVALAVCAVALLVTHPHGLVLAFAAGAGFLALEIAAVGMPTVSRTRGLLMLAGTALIVVLPAVLWLRIGEQSPSLFDAGLGPRLDFRVIDLPVGMYMAHPGLLRNPVLILALAASVLHVKRWRRDRASRLLLAATWVPVVLMLFPPAATLAGRVVSPAQLWRFAWLVPIGSLLGIAAVQAVNWLRPAVRPRLATWILAIATVSGVILVQEVNTIADRGYYEPFDVEVKQTRLSFVRGFRYLLDGSQRGTDAQKEILRVTARRVPAGERVVAEIFLSRALAAFSSGAIPLTPAATPRSDPASRDRDTLLEAGTPQALRRAILDRLNVSYVIVENASPADRDLTGKPGVREEFRGRRYALLHVVRAAGTADPLAAFGTTTLWRAVAGRATDDAGTTIVVRTTWTASRAPDAEQVLVGRILDANGASISRFEASQPFAEAEFPFNHRFIFNTPPAGEYTVTVGIGSEAYTVARLVVTASASGDVQVEIRPAQ